MTAMRDDLERAIADAVQVVVAEREDGTRVVRGLDDETTAKIAVAVLRWMSGVPYDGFGAENFSSGLYSQRNVKAMIEDIEDDA